jgi:hypothetical protein
MRRTIYWRAAICVGAIFGGGVFPSADLGFIGVGPAEGKSYYTRKRVDGKWVNGRFPKKSAAKKEAARKETAKAGSSVKSSRRQARAALAETEAAPAPARMAALPAAKAGPDSQGAAAPGSAASRSPAGATGLTLSEDERLIRLREALRARANALTTGSIAAPRAPEPQSVSLDFRSGTKTTIFSDGTLVTEPFDVGSLKGLAGAFPGSTPASTESAARPRQTQ